MNIKKISFYKIFVEDGDDENHFMLSFVLKPHSNAYIKIPYRYFSDEETANVKLEFIFSYAYNFLRSRELKDHCRYRFEL